jgi:peptidoglycan-associated lipoprotein
MDRSVVGLCLSLSLMVFIAGCVGKNVSSSSGDAASRAGQTKSEEIKPDAIKPIPLERSFERPADTAPSNLARSSKADVDLDTPALGDVFFDYDRFDVRKDAMPVLDANAGWLRANGGKTVLIEGHCDERGTVAYNLVLGEKRARAVKKYLQDMGAQASQLQITSYGETKPFCKQQNEECYQQNRRAHFAIK